MQEERKSRAEERQQKESQQKKLIILILAVVLVGACVVVLLSQGNHAAEQPEMDSQQTNGEAVSSEPNQTESDQTETNQTEPDTVIPVAAEENSWQSVLVNGTHPLADGYVPELVSVDNTSFKFDARAADDLNRMLQDARTEGLSPMICSSYRSWERQTALFEKQVEKQQATGLTYEEAYAAAQTVVAYPGTSEHQSGLAADIVATSYQILDDSQQDTAEQQWLMANCWKYGFILRYPLGKSEFTNIIYEPWHYRYVGAEVAQYITEHELCLEEYWQLVEAQQQQQEQEQAEV